MIVVYHRMAAYERLIAALRMQYPQFFCTTVIILLLLSMSSLADDELAVPPSKIEISVVGTGHKGSIRALIDPDTRRARWPFHVVMRNTGTTEVRLPLDPASYTVVIELYDKSGALIEVAESPRPMITRSSPTFITLQPGEMYVFDIWFGYNKEIDWIVHKTRNGNFDLQIRATLKVQAREGVYGDLSAYLRGDFSSTIRQFHLSIWDMKKDQDD